MVQSADQKGSIDSEVFEANLLDNLLEGSFRLVLVLDEAPADLVRLVSYLEAINSKLLVGLITVSIFEVNGSQVILPQRITPKNTHPKNSRGPLSTSVRPQGESMDGAYEFEVSIESAPEENRLVLRTLLDWASSLEKEGLATLLTFKGISELTSLLPRLQYHCSAVWLNVARLGK